MIRNDDRYNNLLLAIIIQAIYDLLISDNTKRTEFIVARQDAKVFLFDKKSDEHQGFIALCFMLDLGYSRIETKINKIIDGKNNKSFSYDDITDILRM
jgi:hypothetical protein